MSININLIDRTNPNAARDEKAKKLRAISLGVLIITAILAFLIFAIDFRFSASYVRKQEAKLLEELNSHSEVSAKLFVVNTKLSEISKILLQRKKFDEKITKLTSGNMENLKIEEFVISEEGAVFTVTSTSLSSINEYLNYLIDLTKSEEKKFSGVKIEKLTSNETEYRVELLVL
jgi:NADH:ubiquinone oxidoreductase subunit 5 (subunit L)/multisubunit Na+/H+ antiporter MnhA subunit